MKTFLILFVSIGVLIALLLSWGMTLPTTTTLNKVKTIHAPVSKVWHAMSDWEGQVNWRNDIKSVEIISSSRFIEVPVRGPAVEFEIIRLDKYRLIELQMSGPFEGTYQAELVENNGVTSVTISETIVQKGVLGRIFAKLFFDLNEFVDNYFIQLKAHLESTT